MNPNAKDQILTKTNLIHLLSSRDPDLFCSHTSINKMTRISSKRLKRRRRPNVPIILAILTAIVFLSGLTFLFAAHKLDWSKHKSPKHSPDFGTNLDNLSKPKRLSPGHWKKESKDDDNDDVVARTQGWKSYVLFIQCEYILLLDFCFFFITHVISTISLKIIYIH